MGHATRTRQRAIAGCAASGVGRGGWSRSARDASPRARAAADWIVPARDRYEAGQTVTMIGYGDEVRRRGCWPRGPFYAWLRVDPAAVGRRPRHDRRALAVVHPSDLRVGEVVLEDVARGRRPHSGDQHRVSVTFDLPGRPGAGALRGAVLQRPVHRRARALHRRTRSTSASTRPYPIVRRLAADGPGDPVAGGRCPARCSRRAAGHRRRGAGRRPSPSRPAASVPAAPPPDGRRPSAGARLPACDPPHGRAP